MSLINKYKYTYAFLLLTVFSIQTGYGMSTTLNPFEKTSFITIPLVCAGLKACNVSSSNPFAFERPISFSSESAGLQWIPIIKTLVNVAMLITTSYTLLNLHNDLAKNNTLNNTHINFTITGLTGIWQIVNLYHGFIYLNFREHD